MTRTQVALLTLGDPNRVTGGYLFHRRLAERAPRHGADIVFVSIPDVPLPWAIFAGPRWLRTPAIRNADVLVLDSIAAARAAPWLAFVEVPVVGMLHQPIGGMDSHPVARWFQAPFDRRAYRGADVLMVASEWLADQLAAAGVPRGRLRVVPPGKNVDAGRTEAKTSSSHGAVLRRGRSIAALCVANWLPRKGITELLDAVGMLADDVVTLHLVGDTAAHGRYGGRVRQALKKVALRDRVVVHGLIAPAAVAHMYRAADVFVLPSFEEPYGTVWGEAMAAGLPVIGWRAGNLPFLADHGREGMLAPVGDVRALSANIDRIARERELRARMAAAAAARAAARPTWDETSESFFAVIDEVRSRGRERGPAARPSP